MSRVVKTAQEKLAEVAKYSQQLAEGLAKFRESEGYKALLNSMSLFHNYSYRNTAMIMLQNPDASLVAGFSTWKKLGRSVKKGEKGLRIFAPIVRKAESKDDDASEEVRVAGYRMVSVFDVSQTEGKPLPADYVFNGTALAETVEGFEVIRTAVESVAAFPVEVGEVGMGSARGVCMHDERRIVISDELTGADFLRTLVHETVHSILHAPGAPGTREDHEVEAESVAYVVCKRFGIDIGGKSFAYIASWTQDMADEEFEACLSSIQRMASRIIDVIEKALRQQKKVAA